MEIEVSKEEITINKLVLIKKEVINVQNDIIVPDAKPDILNTINCAGNIIINKKEILEGKIKLDGKIDTYIMYLPDSKDDNLRGLNFDLDFSENILIPNITETMDVDIKYNIKNMECKVLNGRKISMKANIELDIKVYSKEDVQMIKTINNVEDIQILNQNYNVDVILGRGKTTVYAKDTVNINQDDELAEILKVNMELVNKDIKISYNKILSKADAKINIVYLTENNSIKNVTTQIPIVGFVDMPNISEENICNINYETKNMIIRPNTKDEHSIYIELEIDEEVISYAKKNIELIQDLYSPSCNIQYSQKEILLISDRNESKSNLNIKERIIIEGIDENDLLDVDIKPQIITTNITKSKIMYTGEVKLNFVFKKENMVESREIKLPFELAEDNLYLTNKIDVENSIEIGFTQFNIKQTGSIDSNIDLSLVTRTSKNVSMNIIDNIEYIDSEDNDEDYDSLIIYIVKPQDSLWKIAKMFKSTVDEIVRMNGIENPDKINVGQKIYIPKFNFSKKVNVNEEQESISI